MGWESAMDEAKKGHRPQLKNWARDRFATDRLAEFEALPAKIHQLEGSGRYSRIARETSASLTPEQFVEKYEKTATPVLISGTVAEEEWPAQRRWTLARLREDFRDRKFKCGEDDDGYKIKVTMRTFVKYMEHNGMGDDSPLYVFDSSFDDDYSAKRILDDYKVPKYFPTNPDQEGRGLMPKKTASEEEKRGSSSSSSSSGGGDGGMTNDSVGYHDLFSLVGERRRPPYRWLLMGPRRSGTCVHIDPLGTSAWNTVVSGRKLWVLFPPGVPKSVVKAKKQIKHGEDDEAINYFIDLIPRLRRDEPSLDIYLFIQGSGETVFVPGGWWHAVLNLEDAVAITQNFCSKSNFEKVWKETRTGRKKMAVKWLKRLHEYHPDLAATAERLNAEDGFVMPLSSKDKKKKAAAEEGGSGSDGSGDEATARRSKKGAKEKKQNKGEGGAELNDDGRKKHESARDAAEALNMSLLGSGGGGRGGSYGGTASTGANRIEDDEMTPPLNKESFRSAVSVSSDEREGEETKAPPSVEKNKRTKLNWGPTVSMAGEL